MGTVREQQSPMQLLWKARAMSLIEYTSIRTEDGQTVRARAPLVISASRRTDIPAFHADWFFARLAKGYLATVNPFNGARSYVSFERTRFVVFWSKNPRPLERYLPLLREKGIGCLVQYTLNDYEEDGLERVPELGFRLETFRQLSSELGRDAVVWRFDPLLLTKTVSVETLLARILALGDILKDWTKRLVFSFADIATYRKVRNNLARFGVPYREWSIGEMMDFAIYLLYAKDRFRTPAVPLGNDTYRSLETAKVLSEMTSRVNELKAEDVSPHELLAGLRSGVPSATWYPETEFLYLRDDAGSFFAAKGGFNDESHNHNDVGTFIYYHDDVPLFIDAGVGTYTKQTFSSERYTIWSMQSDWHSLPVINGVSQQYGRDFRSADVSCNLKKKEFSMDISGAYPQTASCDVWKRFYKMSNGRLTIRDSFTLKERLAADVENFLVLGEVRLPGETYSFGGVEKAVPAGRVVIIGEGAAAELSFPASLTPSVTDRNLDDPRLSNVWGETIRRISFTSSQDAPLSGQYLFNIRILK